MIQWTECSHHKHEGLSSDPHRSCPHQGTRQSACNPSPWEVVTQNISGANSQGDQLNQQTKGS